MKYFFRAEVDSHWKRLSGFLMVIGDAKPAAEGDGLGGEKKAIK